MRADYIIVGQGISGTFLSWYLHKAQKSFVVIDNNDSNSPSRLAAGIINPVTGRRMVTVWMAEEILPFAKQAYDEMGHELNITAISQKNIIDFFPSPFMRENFLKRLTEGNDYIGPVSDKQQFSSFFNYEFGCGEIKPAYTAHLEILLPAWRKQLQDSGSLLEENFDITQLQVSGGKVQYRNLEADKIIFCDGAAGTHNSYFKQLPFAPNKGEALVVEIPGLPASNLFKKSMMLTPLPGAGKDIFWIGSNYIWDFANADPTAAFREGAERVLKEWLKVPYTILEHRAGIRPATLERRPFVGFHPQQPGIGILNGMGTKGCSLAPYFAKQIADHITKGLPIHAEADVKRFTKVLSR
ncbi:MAG: FAD-binding oxidoreductase [Chitinophagaceae bacterium]|nr:FAD-binding oxidoreductase [Chitinophagaceae bacterium]